MTLQARLAALSPDAGADAAYEEFLGWVTENGLSLYPAQDEALLELATGANVILGTPTGSGKSLVAMGAHAMALARGERTFYTAPIKALVSEKFFALCDAFGAENVGMLTGDAAVNPTARLICCTAEVLANQALREGPDADIGQVVMDEFHFYAEPDRGWAWQVPLLRLPRAQFLLMSATLGDASFFRDDLTRRTGRPTAVIDRGERPIPLSYHWAMTPVHETLDELLATRQAPVYVVHFTQAAALERAQALTSITVATRAERDAIAEELRGFRFARGFGATLNRLVRHGIGVHHAGMLPKYRRLVEQLAQQGLLKVICGTDTLGVGINVPIRTVLLTGLAKYDGSRQRLLKAREFHQIAGRAGRAGFDTAGTVVVQAPEHVIENHRALAKAGDDPKARRRVQRKPAPAGFVAWTEEQFERLVAAPPEPLQSRMQVSHAMVLNIIEAPGDPVRAMRALLTDNHEDRRRQVRLQLRAIEIYRSLVVAGIVEKRPEPDPTGRTVRVVADLQQGFALNQPLSAFAVAAFDLLDTLAPSYPLDVVSVVEATLEDPRPVLMAQRFLARGEAVAAMKADGIEYDERMELLEEVTWPKPLAELLETAFLAYQRTHPWVREGDLSPKSVVRDLYERAMTFGDFVAFYRLARGEGIVLRYLSDAYRALRHSVPATARTPELDDLVEWLGEVVRQTDSSLLEEWEELTSSYDAPGVPGGGSSAGAGALDRLDTPRPGDAARALSANPRALRVMVRTAMWRRVELVARQRWDDLADLDVSSPALSSDGSVLGVQALTADEWAEAGAAYFAEYADVGIGPDARGPELLDIRAGSAAQASDAAPDGVRHADYPSDSPSDYPSENPSDHCVGEGQRRVWLVQQVLDDPNGDRDWRLTALVDLDACDDSGELVLAVTAFAPVDNSPQIFKDTPLDAF